MQGAFPEILEGLARVTAALGATAGIEAPGAETARSAAFCLTAYEGGHLHAKDLAARAGDFDPAVRDRLLAGGLLLDEAAAAAQRLQPVHATPLLGCSSATTS